MTDVPKPLSEDDLARWRKQGCALNPNNAQRLIAAYDAERAARKDAEAEIARRNEYDAGHPGMCCGQCVAAIKSARSDADALAAALRERVSHYEIQLGTSGAMARETGEREVERALSAAFEARGERGKEKG